MLDQYIPTEHNRHSNRHSLRSFLSASLTWTSLHRSESFNLIPYSEEPFHSKPYREDYRPTMSSDNTKKGKHAMQCSGIRILEWICNCELMNSQQALIFGHACVAYMMWWYRPFNQNLLYDLTQAVPRSNKDLLMALQGFPFVKQHLVKGNALIPGTFPEAERDPNWNWFCVFVADHMTSQAVQGDTTTTKNTTSVCTFSHTLSTLVSTITTCVTRHSHVCVCCVSRPIKWLLNQTSVVRHGLWTHPIPSANNLPTHNATSL